jgi:D-Tyr-tRNAtyr deacylase
LFNVLADHACREWDKVATGVFGAEMFVNLTNHGPVTFWLEA